MKTSIRSLAIITLTLLGFALSPKAEAVNPPPDGGYPGGNTAEGQNALLNLTTGTFNTAVGFFSLRSNTLGQFNTAVGAGALFFNAGNPVTFAGIENTAVGAGALLAIRSVPTLRQLERLRLSATTWVLTTQPSVIERS